MATILEPNFTRAPAQESSDRSFGFVFAGVFVLIGSSPLLHWDRPLWWAFGAAAAFALAARVRPQFLHFPNRAWLAFGRLMHKVVSPLIMGVIFFLCVTPTGWIMRRLGKDVLSLKRHRDLSSYWITRAPAAPETTTMKNQF